MTRDAIPMRAPLAAPLPEPGVPDGVLVRQLRRGDADGLGDLMREAYAGTVDDNGETAAEHRAEAERTILGGHGAMCWGASLVAVQPDDDASPVAVSLVTRWKELPLLAFALVRPGWQGRGLGTALIGRSANLLHAAGETQWTLAVTRDNPAVRLYRRLGFVEDQSLRSR